MWVSAIGSPAGSTNLSQFSFLLLFSFHLLNYLNAHTLNCLRVLTRRTTWLHFILIKKSSEVTKDLICLFSSLEPSLSCTTLHSPSSFWLYLQKHCTFAFLSKLMPAKAILKKWSSHLPHTYMAVLFQILVGGLVLFLQRSILFQPIILTCHPIHVCM